jgi:hypothetical protein
MVHTRAVVKGQSEEFRDGRPAVDRIVNAGDDGGAWIGRAAATTIHRKAPSRMRMRQILEPAGATVSQLR